MKKTIFRLFVALCLAVTASAPVQADTVRIGWSAWSDAEFVTRLAAKLLRERLDQDVELIETDIARQYQGLANGEIDLMLMAWLPATHEDYMDPVAPRVANLGILYGRARLGWAVPAYIPEDQLSSIEDLKTNEVRNKLDGKITGIDPGAGLTGLSRRAIADYGLEGYELQTSSGEGMSAALERAIDHEEWIVVTGWSPHWKFGAWDLRYLDDPRGSLGRSERVHALARLGFYQDNPEAALMIARMHLSLDSLQQAMFHARENSYEKAVDRFIEDHPALIDYWVTGTL